MVLTNTDDSRQTILDALVRLRDEIPGIDGTLVATTDGHPIVSTLTGIDAASTAAMVAATLGIGTRLAELLGDAALDEATVKTAHGYICVFAIGADAVLTIFASADANLARINHYARLHLDDLLDSTRAITGAQA